MRLYFLLFTAKPGEDSPEKLNVRQGFAHVWVQADNPNQAEDIALVYIRKHHLIPLSLEACYCSDDVQIQDLGTSEVQLLRRAAQYGVALDYIAAAADESPGITEIRPLKS